jgi:hypothetical protein
VSNIGVFGENVKAELRIEGKAMLCCEGLWMMDDMAIDVTIEI